MGNSSPGTEVALFCLKEINIDKKVIVYEDTFKKLNKKQIHVYLHIERMHNNKEEKIANRLTAQILSCVVICYPS